MKFLCVLCDEAMKLVETAPPDRGSLSLVYECPECANRIAMLTNPYETQVVGSLGVKIGPQAAAGDAPAADGAEAGSGKCPFSATAREAMAPEVPAGFEWSTEALERLENVPEFVRPMAKTGIEQYAREKGHERVDAELMDQARDFFGM